MIHFGQINETRHNSSLKNGFLKSRSLAIQSASVVETRQLELLIFKLCERVGIPFVDECELPRLWCATLFFSAKQGNKEWIKIGGIKNWRGKMTEKHCSLLNQTKPFNSKK